MRRSLLFVAVAGLAVLGLSAPAIATADMGSLPSPEERSAAAAHIVDLVKVQGFIDRAQADYVRGTIEQAERSGAVVILQIDSLGTYGDEAERLARFVRAASVPVVSWVGPSGGRAQGGALFLVYSAGVVAMAPGAGIGPAQPFDLGTSASGEPSAEASRDAGALVSLAPGAGVREAGVRGLVSTEQAAGSAQASGAVSVIAAGISDLLQRLDGRAIRTAGGQVLLITGQRPGLPITVRFHEMGPARRVLHAVGTPAAVYVLLLLGLWAVAFELTQPGVGVAGIAGAGALALAVYGLTVVPVHWPGLVLLLAGVGLQGLDVVRRRVATPTVAGTLAFLAGSVLAWKGVAPSIDLSWWLIALFTVGGFLYFGFALTVAIRSRRRVSEAQVGLVGLVGEVRTDLDPEGGVYVKGTLWRARSGDGPIPRGARVRVRGIDGLILRVEPE